MHTQARKLPTGVDVRAARRAHVAFVLFTLTLAWMLRVSPPGVKSSSTCVWGLEGNWETLLLFSFSSKGHKRVSLFPVNSGPVDSVAACGSNTASSSQSWDLRQHGHRIFNVGVVMWGRAWQKLQNGGQTTMCTKHPRQRSKTGFMDKQPEQVGPSTAHTWCVSFSGYPFVVVV